MKKLLVAVALGAGLMGSASAATVSSGSAVAAATLAPENDFLGTVLSGYSTFAEGGTFTISGISGSDLINFTVIGAEAGHVNTFTINLGGGGSAAFTETSHDGGHPAAELYSVDLGNYLASSLLSLVFSSSGGWTAELSSAFPNGQVGMGIFYNAGSITDFVLAFDDHGAAPEDNHDDLLVRVSILPEPAAWAFMILGFAGLALARRRALVRA